MIRFRKSAALLLGPAAVLWAVPPMDDARGALLEAFPAALRWDNLESLPEWCGGARFLRRDSVHRLRLEEGRVQFVPMPAAGWLRLRADRGLDRLRAGITDGSGVSVPLPDRGVKGNHERLYGPLPDQPALIRLACPQDGQGPLDLALFTARLDVPDPLPPYRRPLPLPGPTRRLGRPGDLQDEAWEELPPDRPVSLSLQGPCRLALEARLLAGQEHARDGLRFQLGWQLADRPRQVADILSAVDTSEAHLLEGHPSRLGRLETLWIEVPPGLHLLTLDADRPLLIRLHAETPRDILLPQVNRPTPWPPGLSGNPGDTARLAALDAEASDLRWREGGLAELARLDAWVQERPEDLALRRLRARMAAVWTTYRSLLPRDLVPGSTLRPAFAWLPSLAEAPWPPRRQAGTAAELEQTLASLPLATFHPLAGGLRYDLDPRSAPTELRLLVDRSRASAPGTLRIELGEAPAFEVTLDYPVPVPNAWRAPGPQDLGLALAAQDRGWRPQPLLQGSERAPLLPPLPLVAAGAVRIPLPPGVGQVRIIPTGTGLGDLSVALLLRTARSPQAPTAAPDGLNPANLKDWPVETGPAMPWLPLRRWLDSQAATFRSRVVPDPLMAELLAGQPSPEAGRHQARARELETQGRTVAAVEAWVLTFRAATGQARAEALEGLAAALFRAGEPGLAEAWLKAAFLRGAEPVSGMALRLLDARFRRSGDTAALLGLLATAAQANPLPERLEPLASALLTEGQAEQALRVLALLPPGTASESWIRAGRALRREEAIRKGLDALADPERHALWEGILRLDLGLDLGSAWIRAGATGEPWRAAREEALRLAPALAADPGHPDLERAWSAWVQRHPGPWSWRPEPWLVREAAGWASLHARELDSARGAFRAAPDHPVEISVVGPVRLRIEAHPLHQAGSKLPLRGTLDIRGGTWTRRIPFMDNWPSPSLRLEGCAEVLPGQGVRGELELPAGRHDLALALGDLEGFVTVAVLRPEVPLGPLPQRNPAVRAALGTPAVSPPLAPGGFIGESGIYLTESGAWRRVDLDLETLRHRLLAPLPEGPRWEVGAAPPEARPPGESWEDLLAAPDPDPGDPRAVAARLDALAAAQGPGEALLAKAEALAARCPEATDLSSGLLLLREGAGWRPLTTASGAGIHLAPREAGVPEDPATRLRMAFLPPGEQQLLSGLEGLVFHLQQPHPWTLELELAAFDPGLAPPQPLTVRAILGESVWRWPLAPGEPPRRIALPLPGGRHALRLELETPYRGQRAVLRFPKGLGEGRLELPERRFEVARAEAPLRLDLEGPRWVRVDRRFPDGDTATTYHFLPRGPQHLEVRPDPGEPERLCAFSVQERLPQRVVLAPRPWALTFPSVPERPPLQTTPGPILLQDAYPLGGQEDGTQVTRLEAATRRDPEAPDAGDPQRSIGLAFAHRHLDPRTGRAWRLEARARHLEASGQSLRAEASLDLPIGSRPLVLAGRADLGFQQGAGSDLASARAALMGLEFGARLPLELGRRSRLQSEATLLWRGFTFTALPDAARHHLDLDLWSPFKDRNRLGLRLAETLALRPWRDTLLEARAGVMFSQAGPGLAVATLEGAWHQRLGYLEAFLAGRMSHYGSTAMPTGPRNRPEGRLGLEGRFWTSRQNLLTAAAELRYDGHYRVWSGGLSMGWTFSRGRGLRDLRPSATFPQLEALELSRSDNNTWKELPR